jgi:aerobic-type carbon monoxide dehydrogenase small subunit (CoxS/CutS family)
MANVKQLHVNGSRRALDADADRALLSVLRDDLDLTGCKYGCGEGRCGACTVLVDGKAVRSCNTPVAKAQDKKIQTIEGIADGDKLHPLQEAFLEAGALQCGYCTPGMLMSALALLTKNAEPTRDDVISGLSGNVCRCGVYGRIVTAVLKAAKAMKEAKR